MELQVVIIGAVVFVISAVLIYLISAFTMKEKTFEEVIAEQKRQKEEQLLKEKQEKKAEKDTRRRFKPKGKEKVKGDQSPKVSVSDSEIKEHKMVNLELEPEIIEPVEIDKPLKMSKKKEKPAKPILHNRDEKTPVVSEEFVEEIVHRVTPKDDLELKHSHDIKKEAAEKPKKEKAKKREVEQQKPVVEEIIRSTESHVQAAAPPQVSATKISFKENEVSKLISSVKTTSMTEPEVQSLIDILLSKQGGASVSTDWNKKSQKGDPVALLRKQCEEKERALQEEQQMVMAANTKVKETRQELNQEKMRYQALEKNFKEKMEYQGREVQALHSRLQHTHDQHMVETNQMREMIQKLEAQVGDQSRLQRLVDENNGLKELLAKTQTESMSPSEANNLKQKVSIMEKELSSNALKLNTSENLKKSLEQKLATKEAELKKYISQQSSNEGVLEKRIDEISVELRKSEAKNSTLTKDLKSKEQAVDTATKECAYLKTKLQDLKTSLTESDQSTREMEEKLKVVDRQKMDIEGNLKNLQKRIETFDQEKSELLTEIKALKQENSNLGADLKTAQENVQKASQEVTKTQQNGDLHADIGDMISIAEHDKQLAAKDIELSTLTKEAETSKTEISTLKQELEKQKKKNNELREKNWKAMDALEKSEKSVSEKVQSAIKERTEEASASQSDVESFDKSVMQRLFPDVSVKDINNHKDWMKEFETQVANYLKNVKQQQSTTSDTLFHRIFPGTTQKSAKYETKISDLESHTQTLEKKLQEAEKSRDSLSSSLKEAEDSCKNLESQISQLSNSQGDSSAKYENRVRELESQNTVLESKAQAAEQSKDLLKSSLQEAENSCTKLQSQVAQYRNVLTETENKLTQLENSVEAEEKKWQEKIQTKELELQQAQAELGNYKQEAEKAVGSQEMKERVAELETQLSSSETKCSVLESQVKEAENKITEYNVQIVELQKSSATLTVLTNDVEDLRKQLEDEKKKNKDLASQVVKLNGIIKTGHDALTQEQNLVKKLQEQLASGSEKQNSTSVPNATGTEIEQLRTKLVEKEKQLEKEISANKLLSQRLAQLGVMASSQSSLNEAGTSV